MTHSIRGHLLVTHHLLHNIVVGDDTVVACEVVSTHDGLEVFARKTNLLGHTLPQDGHSILGNREVAEALRDHIVDVTLTLA